MRNFTRDARGWWAPLRMLPICAFLPFAGCDWLGITEAPTPDTLLEFSAVPATAPADNASIVLIVVRVDTATSTPITEVKFATTLGTFAGGTATFAAPVDAEGRALAQLKAPTEAGTAIVAATAAGQTRTLQVTFTTPVNGFTSVSASPQTAPADGASTTVVTAQVNLTALPAVMEVKFATTMGAFLGNVTSVTVPVDASGVAQAQLRAPADIGTAIVSATAAGATRTTVVGFVPAPPTRLELTSDIFVLPAGLAHSVNLTATPLRSIGTPSPGTIVTFTADTLGGSDGSFGQFSASSVLVRSGSATSRFSAGDTSYRGPVLLRATATQAGQSVTDSTVVTVVTSPPS